MITMMKMMMMMTMMIMIKIMIFFDKDDVDDDYDAVNQIFVMAGPIEKCKIPHLPGRGIPSLNSRLASNYTLSHFRWSSNWLPFQDTSAGATDFLIRKKERRGGNYLL